MSKRYTWLSRIVVMVIVIFLSYVFLPRLFLPLTNKVRMENLCQDSLEAKQIEISGIVLNKYKDTKNHYMRMIDFINERNTTSKTDIMMNDGSGAYDFILPGDSITKELNSLELKVTRNGNTKVFTLDFGCTQMNDHELK